MSLTTADLIYPTGELMPLGFPDNDIEDAVTTWIAEAEAKVADLAASSQDSTAAHWVYYRAYNHLANRIAQTPSSEEWFQDVSRQWSQGRVDFFEKRATEHLDKYNEITGDDALVGLRTAKFGVY